MPSSRATGAARRITCGVLVNDGDRLLLGHATRSPRWDIPKGVAQPGESLLDAAIRELREETGLQADPAALTDIGVHPYLRGKDLALFAWKPARMPDPASLVCRSMVLPPHGQPFPEMDRFAVFVWAEALVLVGRNLAQVLTVVRPRLG